ncbi:MAG: hypothetical protein J0I84_05900, partial [Terrimonas sp.]|nr:hypothetical protein [Terrimonas sp.]
PRPEAFADKNWVNYDFWLLNSSYLKLKNIQLGYTLPSALTDRVNIQKLRICIPLKETLRTIRLHLIIIYLVWRFAKSRETRALAGEDNFSIKI